MLAPASSFRPVQPALPLAEARDGLVYREIDPANGLGDDVAYFWTIAAPERRRRPYLYRVVPDGCIDVVFDLGNAAGGWIYGALDRPIVADLEGRVDLFGVRIRPGRFGALVGAPAGAVAARVLDVADVLGSRGRDWYATLLETRDTAARVTVTSAHLGALRRFPGPADRLGTAVADAIVADPGLRVETLATRFGRSARHLGRVCHLATGLRPKRLARVVRAQRALRLLRDAPDTRLATLAAELGFADQAHLTGELGTLAGATPAVLRREARSDFSKTPSPHSATSAARRTTQ